MFATEFQLYRGGQMMAAALASADQLAPLDQPGTTIGLQLPPVFDDRGQSYLVELFAKESPDVLGYSIASVRVEINHAVLGHDVPWKPLSWYTAEPTDWHTGLVRWAETFPLAVREPTKVPPSVWTLTARRAQ